MPLDEKALRKPTFDESASHPVTFGAAGTFWLPKPHVRTRPIFKDRRIVGKYVVTDDPEFNALSKAIEESGTYAEVAAMAAYLLGRNYDLSDDQLAEVLEYDPRDESPDRWAMQVLAVVGGYTGGKA